MTHRDTRRELMRGNEVESILWHRLIDLYRQDRRFQAIIGQDLHPLWKQAGSPDITEWPKFAREFALLTADTGEQSDPYRAYIGAVLQTVRTMGLFDRPQATAITLQSQALHPSTRAATQVLLSVSYWPEVVGGHGTLTFGPSERATVELEIVANDGRVRMNATGDVAGKPDETAFAGDLDEIEEHVHEAVTAWVASIRRRNRQTYPHFNTGSIQKRLQEVEALFKYLYRDEWSRDATQYKQFQRLAKMMELALPPRIET